jgi:hypothetical protein
MEEHRKSRSREKAVARANKKKQERAQKKRAEMQNEPEDPAKRTCGRSNDWHSPEDAGVATGV